MANATYNKKMQRWEMTYTDRTKFRKDGKYLNRTKKVTDREYPTLPARQKRLREAEMIKKAQDLEDACVSGKISTTDPDKSVVAADYLEQMEIVTAESGKARAIKDRKTIINAFVKWLRANKNYKKLHLEQISRAIAREFLISLINSDYAEGSVDKYRKAMCVVWGLIIEELEDKGSKINLINPWAGSKRKRQVSMLAEQRRAEKGQVAAIEKKPFTMPQLREIIATHYYEHPVLANMWKLGFLTGWRIGDLVNLKWEQIDLDNRTIKLISGKTEIKTILYLTDYLIELLKEVKTLNPDSDKVFYYKGNTNIGTHNRKVLDGMGLTETAKSGHKDRHLYTFHSLRGTMKTALKVKDYNESRLDYLVGHRGKGMDAKHYDKFYSDPKAATADILEFLQSALENTDND